MTATPEALSPAVEQDPLASPDPRRGLIFVGVFIALCLVLAGIAFLPAMPTDVAPFVLALGPLVVALALGPGGGRRRDHAADSNADGDPAEPSLVPRHRAAGRVGGDRPDRRDRGRRARRGAVRRRRRVGLVVLLVVLIPAFAEELAWRGFGVPRLLPFMSPLGAALVLAVPWTIMHLPLVLVPGSINEGLAVIPMVLALFGYRACPRRAKRAGA